MRFLTGGEPSPTCTFTVFTPTFNRARTLQRVYDSLSVQTFKDFEWLIVDDGSTDNTCEVVKRWQRQGLFAIRYQYQENKGKHIAHNIAIDLACGELFLTLDSDDACVPQALQRLVHYWNLIPLGERASFTGVTALCMDECRRLVGNRFPHDVTDSNSLEIRFKHKVKGEKWGFHRTEILRAFPFPQLQGENFIPEDVIWRAIARNYKTRYINETLRTYFNNDDDQGKRLSVSSVVRHAVGRRLQNVSQLNHDLGWMRYAPLMFLRVAANYARCSFHCGLNVGKQWRDLNSLAARVLWVGMLPVGYFLFFRDLWRSRLDPDQVHKSGC